ncbi:hypothetical protein [Massilia sp. METH4]|uniref:hypothetical protein n=1 Tax=Massilia sp. METH4 TaxID=3123041 RepID=UPI0030D5EF10
MSLAMSVAMSIAMYFRGYSNLSEAAMFQTKLPRDFHAPEWVRVAINVAAGAALGVLFGGAMLLVIGAIT